ncbi:MAG: hypothetical protein WCB27_24025 [Thermoguttaceae bacterium]|jgi:hypothetical protein
MIFRLLVSAVAVSRLSLLGLVVLPLSAPVWGDDTPARKEAAPELKGQALILMGLPGDKEHEKLFTDTARQWRDWLIGPLGFRPGDVRILSGGAARNGVAQGPATRETIEKEAARLRQSLRPGDRLWVFFLGHANYDGEHAWFHLPGPDLREDEIGKLFAGLPCREQVFWMTTAESGRFVKDLSAKGRIVIAATRSSGEDNEPEFPQALSAVVARPLEALDVNKDGKLSVLELYYRVMAEVRARYAADKRLSTEHAQLDDNGDGVGTERPLVPEPGKKIGPGDDGILSLSTILPYPSTPPKEERPEPAKNLKPNR